MRVVSGHLGGRRLEAPRGVITRPSSDRVREALFSRLQAYGRTIFDGARVLDAYAGSGALGIEALSRGAEHATFIERDSRALATIERNLSALGVSSASTVIRGDVVRHARRGLVLGHPFSLLFLDPPYRINKSEVRGVIESLVLSGSLDPQALVVWEHASGETPEWPVRFQSLGARAYGGTTVDIACRKGE